MGRLRSCVPLTTWARPCWLTVITDVARALGCWGTGRRAGGVMPKVSDIPKVLRPFQSLGVVLSPSSLGGGDHATGDCPFCGREGKFSVSLASGQWDCK